MVPPHVQPQRLSNTFWGTDNGRNTCTSDGSLNVGASSLLENVSPALLFLIQHARSDSAWHPQTSRLQPGGYPALHAITAALHAQACTAPSLAIHCPGRLWEFAGEALVRDGTVVLERNAEKLLAA
mmetsp:Transcript_15997/g.48037  ORF Transcript_15997/g.48037 Transcript_15997/m.48037 type:complete len:126 (+) Transcript_15997:126-503(+)